MPATVPTLTDVLVPASPPSPGEARVPEQRPVRTPPDPRRRPPSAAAPMASWVGVLALAALALGALAIGRRTVRRLSLRHAHIAHLQIDDLDVRRLHVRDSNGPRRR